MSWEIFVKFLASTSKISKPTNSVSAWSAHETNQRSCRRIPLPIFWKKILNRSPSFAAKNNFCLPGKLIYSWITGLSWLTRQMSDNSLTRFFLLRRFCQIFTRGKFCWRCVWKFVRFGQIRLKKWAETRSCFFLHFFRALAASCVL